MTNREKLRQLFVDVLLLEDGEFRFDLRRADVATWDSLAVVSIAVGIEEVFNYHMNPEQATAIAGVDDVMKVLTAQGISFDE